MMLILVGLSLRSVDRSADHRNEAHLFERDLRYHPRSVRQLAAVAGVRLNSGDPEGAERHARAALEIFDRDMQAWRILGFVLYQRDEWREAAEALEKSFLHGGAGHEAAILAAADAHKSLGNYSRAIELLAAYVAHSPRRASPLNNLAWYLITAEPTDLRDANKALLLIQEAGKLEPQAGDILDTHVSVLEACGKPEEAKQVMTAGLQRVPEGDPFRASLVRRLREMK
jgi:tetratricopeptide (TPR) repeat protein